MKSTLLTQAKVVIKNDKVERIKDFLNEVSLSKFTFCPRGNGSSSFRLFESLEAGSVPIITGMIDYPFRDKVDYKKIREWA